MTEPPRDYAVPAPELREESSPAPLRLWLIAIFILAIGCLALAVKAVAHEAASGMSYSTYCCQGDQTHGDCQAISEEAVRAILGGYGVTLLPGDHRRVTKRHDFAVPQSKVYPSTDGQYHACLFPDEDTLRCFYAPPPGA